MVAYRTLHQEEVPMTDPGAARIFRWQIWALMMIALVSSAVHAMDQIKILPSDNAAYQNFGASVCIDHDYAVIGAKGDQENGSNSGAAYVFHHVSGSWIQQAKLLAGEGAAGDSFGVSAAIDGDYVVVGAIGDDHCGEDCGAAYIFHHEAGDWVERAKLTASDCEARDNFGKSVSISGDYVVVGADFHNEGVDSSGAAYVFHRSGSTWTQQAKLVISSGEQWDLFGRSVSVDGDYLVVGAYRDDDLGTDSGSAYVFHRSGITWTQEAKLTANDGAPYEWFGFSVSIHDTTILVGAPYDNSNVGAAYVFHHNGIEWEQQPKLTASDGAGWDRFGCCVSTNGTWAVVGADEDDDDGDRSGSAYIFQYDGSAWAEQAKLTAHDGAAGDIFGYAVSMDSSRAMVGAYWDDDNGAYSGSAYLHSLGSLMTLAGNMSGSDLVLEWTPWHGATGYWVYGAANKAYFIPSLDPPDYEYRLQDLSSATTTWPSSSGIGDPADNWTYIIVAVDGSGQEMNRSNRFGEHDFAGDIP